MDQQFRTDRGDRNTEAAGHGGWVAIGLLAMAMVSFALSNNLVRLSFDYDVNRLTAVAVRTWVAILFVAGVCLVGRVPLYPRLRGLLRLIWIGALFAVQSFSLFAAFKLIPVSLAILIFFTFPILVGLIGWATGHERMTLVKAGSAVAAFIGLMLALDIFNVVLDWRGVMFAAVASLTLALNILGSHRAMQDQHRLTVVFVMMLVAAVPYTLALAAGIEGGVSLPAGAEGWSIFIPAMVLGPVALLAFYIALPLTTGLRASMMMNGEPVMTIFFAAILIGEILFPIQYAGAAIVILSIYAITRYGHRR